MKLTDADKKTIKAGFTHPCKGVCSGYSQAAEETRAQVRAEVWEEAAKELDLSADHFLKQDKYPAWDRTRAEGISTPGYAGSALRQMAVNFRAKEKA